MINTKTKNNMKKINKLLNFCILYKKTLQDKVSDENEYESPFDIFTKNLDESKNESFS